MKRGHTMHSSLSSSGSVHKTSASSEIRFKYLECGEACLRRLVCLEIFVQDASYLTCVDAVVVQSLLSMLC